MEKYVFEIIAFLVGSLLIGLVALLINGLKDSIKELKDKIDIIFNKMVTEASCKERREGMEKDINNLGNLVRSK